MTNPWNITSRQGVILDAVIEYRCDKRAADALGVSLSTVSVYLHRAKQKMNAYNRLDTLLKWYEFRRGQA